MHHGHHFGLGLFILIVGIGVAVYLVTSKDLGASGLAPNFGSAPAATNAMGVPPAAPQAPSASNPNLAGHWTLNKDQSDDPRQKMQQAMGGEGGGHRGEGRGGRGGGMMEMSQLVIEQTDKSVKVTNGSGRVIAAYPEEQQARPSAGGDGGNGEEEGHERRVPVAKWQGSQLVASNENPRGGSMSRTFELSSDGKQLIVTTKMQRPNMSQPVSIRFVYDATKTGSTN